MERLCCAFTGHRPQKFKWKYDEEHPDCIKLKLRLAEQIATLANSGVLTFISGMAQAVDQWAALEVLALKKRIPEIRLICALPCEEQATKWTTEAQKRYFDILSKADCKIFVHRQYTKNCFLERNQYMIDHAHILLAVYNGEKRGGTAATINYAKQKGRLLIAIHPETLRIVPSTICFDNIANNIVPIGNFQ